MTSTAVSTTPKATLSSTTLNRIVLGTDFSPVSERAATYARGLALSFGASVDVVHVFDTDVYLDDAEPRLRTLDDRVQARSDRLETLAKRFVAAGVQTKMELPMVRPGWNGLLKAAEADEADLIVVATRSKAQLKRVFVGSTVEELIRHASLPVLTVGPHVEAAPDGPLEFKRIVYATAFAPEAERAAQVALLFAEHGGANVYVCHVKDGPPDPDETRAEGEAREIEARAILERRIAASALGAFACELAVVHGAPAAAILEFAEKVRADLIVMGPRKHSFWLTHVKRGVTLEVLAAAKCPVLTVH
jgi:nucleotide-binding universal stress UspA family protein